MYGLGLDLENFPKNVKFFNFFPSDKKNLFRLGQKVSGSKAGQPYKWIGLLSMKGF